MELFLRPLTKAGLSMDYDELECMIANLIYRVRARSCTVAVRRAWSPPASCAWVGLQGFVKGYMSHERRTLVVSKTTPCPPLASVLRR